MDATKDNTNRNASSAPSQVGEAPSDLNIASKFGSAPAARYAASSQNPPSQPTSASSNDPQKPKKKKRDKTSSTTPVSAPPTSNQPMILVTVNDRLGTKAQIPCLASDPVGLFKRQVAARIGRQPHEILLKRQGERPFKDMLTLEDYGVGNGVQLDLELDTGD